VACEINTCDELLLTEMIFENVFDGLDAAESAALLSALVLQAKCGDEVNPPTPALAFAYETTMRIGTLFVIVVVVVALRGQRTRFNNVCAVATALDTRQHELGVMLDPDWIKSILNPGLLVVVWEWAKGRPFASLMNITSLDEGIIVRAVTRLDETCREVKNAARVLGDPVLLTKMETASKMIKRDVCFATSLYVS